MATVIACGSYEHRHGSAVMSWLPLVIFPAAVGWWLVAGPPWVLMWALAISIYLGLKWFTFAAAPATRQATWRRSLGYLLFWPGMDARAFVRAPKQPGTIRWIEALAAVAKIACGAALVYGLAPQIVQRHPLLAGWIGMAGIVLLLHFGLFHLLSIVWQRAGVEVAPIMNHPLISTSLTDFWGRRWNSAFRDLAHQHVFRPLVGPLGAGGATLAVFLASGIVHDIVISLPVRAGVGLPTLYFLIQAAGLLLQRSSVAQGLGLGRGWPSRVLTALIVLGPLPLLFHRPFVEQVVLPTLAFLRAI